MIKELEETGYKALLKVEKEDRGRKFLLEYLKEQIRFQQLFRARVINL